MSEATELPAEIRKDKINSRLLRNSGRTPAIVYGEKKDPLPISLDTKSIKKQIESTGFFSKQFVLNINGEKHKVLPKDLQLHPVKETIVHLDFLRVGENTRVTVSVPVIFINENLCPGLKQGGVINIVRHEVEVRSPVTKIPENLEINLDGIEIGDSIHISAVKLDTDVKPIISDRDFTIATLAPPTVIKEVEKTDEETGEDEAEKTEEKKEESKDEKKE
ncbi:MAG: 50S ribosomal protein L25/general stress protein Ctc [Rickettsiales bacterium]|nr:50S ribosomal protein L25/general stress protein Ctc [Rickettsiales bacterium]